METNKYTTHPTIWYNIMFIPVAITSIQNLIRKPSDTISVVLLSLIFVLCLVMTIKCVLAWHAYVEISGEGVKMKGCAKRVFEHQKEIVEDIFVPWENIEEINGGINGPILELKTGEKIVLTQLIYIDSRTLRKAFEQYKPKTKPKTEQTQEPFEVVGVIGLASDNTSLNEFTATE